MKIIFLNFLFTSFFHRCKIAELKKKVEVKQMSTKYIFVTGGVVSGLGKGISAASLGRLFKVSAATRLQAKIRSLYQCGSRNNVPFPTW